MSLWIQRLRLKKLNLYKVCDNMIREKIIVEYYENRETNEITLNYDYTQDYYQVPACVEKEANELQKIRRKHQNDNTFNFWITDYPKRVVREADH